MISFFFFLFFWFFDLFSQTLTVVGRFTVGGTVVGRVRQGAGR